MAEENKKKKLLLVEDEQFSAAAQRQMLECAGYDVVVASRGEDAVEWVRADRDYDIVLMDIDLGEGIDGTEAARQILSFSDIPILFLSGHAEPAIVARTEQISSYGYVLKNSGEAVILASIRMAFRLNEAYRSVERHKEDAENANGRMKLLMQELEKTNMDLLHFQNQLILKEREVSSACDLYADIIESARELVWQCDASWHFSFLNAAWLDFFGYLAEDMLSRHFSEFISSDSPIETFSSFASLLEKDVVREFELPVIIRDGATRILLVSAKRFFDAEGCFLGVRGSAFDVTERKAREESQRQAHDGSESMLKELQHRVKNNFNMITSLVSLESRLRVNPETSEVLENIRRRVSVLSALYTVLYSTGEMQRVDAREYMRQITESILSSQTKLPAEVAIHSEFDDFFLDVRQAAPIGLILNELVTNAVKHAFPDGNGQLDVLLRYANGRGELVVKDSGCGMPEGFDMSRNERLGLKLVALLSQQIDGEFSFESKQGSVFFIKFPVSGFGGKK